MPHKYDDAEEEEEANENEKEEEEVDPKNVVTLDCPQTDTVWEHGCPKLKVKVNWTAVLDRPECTNFLHRCSRLPRGYSIDYRSGIHYE
jgi:hypothetical protein